MLFHPKYVVVSLPPSIDMKMTNIIMGACRRKATLSIVVLLLLLVDRSVADALQVSLAKKTRKVAKWKGVSTNKCGLKKTGGLSKLSQSVDASSDLVTFTKHDSVNKIFRKQVTQPAAKFLTGVPTVIGSAVVSIGQTFRRGWWSLPMLLACVPLYSSLVLGTVATMPSWWPLTRMDHILASPYAKLIIGVFLGSNISYYIAGSYLLLRETGALAHNQLHRPLQGYPLLGVLVLAAGTVSTVFHSVQALGSFRVAEVLCYVDHAVAISAIFYFWQKCGKPSRTTAILSALGLGTLVVVGPHYAWLHSAWHFLSAAAAVGWAHDGYAKRVTKMELQPDDDEEDTFPSSFTTK
jgi:hypothetical protein